MNHLESDKALGNLLPTFFIIEGFLHKSTLKYNHWLSYFIFFMISWENAYTGIKKSNQICKYDCEILIILSIKMKKEWQKALSNLTCG